MKWEEFDESRVLDSERSIIVLQKKASTKTCSFSAVRILSSVIPDHVPLRSLKMVKLSCLVLHEYSAAYVFLAMNWNHAGKFYTLTTGANGRRWEKMKDRLRSVVDSFQIFKV